MVSDRHDHDLTVFCPSQHVCVAMFPTRHSSAGVCLQTASSSLGCRPSACSSQGRGGNQEAGLESRKACKSYWLGMAGIVDGFRLL